MIQPHIIPTPLPHPTWENLPVVRGNSREWDGSLYCSATAYSHSSLKSQTSEKIPVVRGFFQEWDGSLYDSTAHHSHSTAAPNMGEFTCCAGKFSRVGRIASLFSYSLFPLHCRTQTPEKIPVSRGFFREWDGSRYGSATRYSHSIVAGGFPVMS